MKFRPIYIVRPYILVCIPMVINFYWSVAVYKLQNLDFSIAERSRAVREAGVEFSDQEVALKKVPYSLKIEKKSWKKSEFSGFHTYVKRLGTPSFDWSVAVYKLQNLDFGIAERSRSSQRGWRWIFRPGGCFWKKFQTRWKSKKNREKSRNFLVFHTYGNDSELQVSIDLWPCISSKTSILASLSALEQSERLALNFDQGLASEKKVPTRWDRKKIVKKVGIFWFSHLWKRLGMAKFRLILWPCINADIYLDILALLSALEQSERLALIFSDQGVASEKSSDSLKIEKKSWKKSEFSGFHTYGNDSELQVSIDLWPCISSKTSILASLSALEQSERLALNFQTRGLLWKKFRLAENRKKIVKKVGIFWFSHLWKRLGTPSFDWSVAVYKLQNLDFGIAERSRAVREAGVEFSDQRVASEKSSDSLKMTRWKSKKNREKSRNFLVFTPMETTRNSKFRLICGRV